MFNGTIHYFYGDFPISYVSHYQRVNPIKIPLNNYFPMVFYGFPMVFLWYGMVAAVVQILSKFFGMPEIPETSAEISSWTVAEEFTRLRCCYRGNFATSWYD